jgi:hypothetical protein
MGNRITRTATHLPQEEVKQPVAPSTIYRLLDRHGWRQRGAGASSAQVPQSKLAQGNRASFSPYLSSKKISDENSQANFRLSSGLYNKAERGKGRNLAENAYSAPSILRRVA